jgi:hypothetical protein
LSNAVAGILPLFVFVFFLPLENGARITGWLHASVIMIGERDMHLPAQNTISVRGRPKKKDNRNI